MIELYLATHPTVGAHIMTPRPGYAHHGVYVGEGRVVHYAGLRRGLRRGPVQEVSFEDFTAPLGVWRQVPTQTAFESAEVVRRARSRLGENRYRMFTNNCEHFCHWCLHGEPHSFQVQRRVRAVLRFIVAQLASGVGAGWRRC